MCRSLSSFTCFGALALPVAQTLRQDQAPLAAVPGGVGAGGREGWMKDGWMMDRGWMGGETDG